MCSAYEEVWLENHLHVVLSWTPFFLCLEERQTVRMIMKKHVNTCWEEARVLSLPGCLSVILPQSFEVGENSVFDSRLKTITPQSPLSLSTQDFHTDATCHQPCLNTCLLKDQPWKPALSSLWIICQWLYSRPKALYITRILSTWLDTTGTSFCPCLLPFC